VNPKRFFWIVCIGRLIGKYGIGIIARGDPAASAIEPTSKKRPTSETAENTQGLNRKYDERKS
jgi:hypothetical protein